jgi:type IV pilus assembly protein PilQ
MDKQLFGVTGLLATSLLVATSQPVWANTSAPATAPTQVTGVRLSPTQNGVDVVLQTQGGSEKPQIFNVNNKDNSLTSYVFNAKLSTAKPFRQDNPAPGIAYIAVLPDGNNGVQIKVAGQSAAPTGQITRKDQQGIVLSIAGKAATTASVPSSAAPSAPTANSATSAPARMSGAVNIPVPAPKQIAQAGTPVTPLVPNPTLNTGAPIAPAAPVPPLLPRASAPPVGDMSVSQVDTAPPAIDLGTAERIPRLVLRDAPVREVLSLLARAAGLNLAFAETPGSGAAAVPGGPGGPTSGGPTISLDIENEAVQDVFNYVLRIACVPGGGGAPGGGGGPQCNSLEANRVGRTIFVGVRLPDDARNTISRTIRLNQVPSSDASAFLTTQGAETQQIVSRTEITEVGGGGGGGAGDQGGNNAARQTTTVTRSEIIPLRAVDGGSGPLPLRGLSVAANNRLNTITLTGTPKKVEVATAFLTQLDARKRQVAVNVKIIDVNLAGIDQFTPSFSFGVGDSFFSVDGGAALFNFGGTRPPSNSELLSSNTTPPTISNAVSGQALTGQPFINTDATGGAISARAPLGTSSDPFAPGITATTPSTTTPAIFDPTTGRLVSTPVTTPGTVTFGLPTLFQFPTRFLARLQAQIQSRNAKILTDPTVVVQEGERSTIRLTQDVITNQRIETTFNNGVALQNVTFERQDAGLTLDLLLDRIDDNGFVTLSVNPAVRAPASTQTLTSQAGSNTITLLSRRELNSGKIRLRDGQTLMLAGIIQEGDRSEVRKIPILGDIPLLGSLFRSTNRTKERNEVIIMLTPRIIDDSDRATYGYGYTPSADVQRMMQQR